MDPLIIYKWYQHAMAGVGQHMKPPANTPIEKTYQYRAVEKFAKQVDEWGLSDKVACSLVYAVVRYGKKKNLLKKGTQLLNMKAILEICYSLLKEEVSRNMMLVTELARSKQFLDKRIQNCDASELLVTKEQRKGSTNLTRWYRSGDLVTSYIALSANCMRAISLIPIDERPELPTDIALLKIRLRLLSDADLSTKICEILGSDLIIKGTQLEHSDR